MKISPSLQAKLYKLGLALIALSLVPWAVMPFLFMPFVGISAARAGVIAGALVVTAEVIFYAGIALAGKEAYTRLKNTLKSRMKSWSGRNDDDASAPKQ
jgi:integral membrane sensor domain MASE1